MSPANKGSVLVSALMFFSIIITVCVSCISMTYSNNDYSKIQYEQIKIEELALSGIEVMRSNILTQAKYAIENFDEEDNFKNYFLGNTREIIGDISKSGLDNVRVSLKGKANTDSEGNIIFRIESVCKDGNYVQRIGANVKIINPWNKYDIDTGPNVDDESKNILYYNKDEFEYIKNNENIDDDIDTTEKHKESFDYRELVVIYNYEEI